MADPEAANELVERVLADAAAARVAVEPEEPKPLGPAPAARHAPAGRFVRFEPGEGRAFYGYWQPAARPAPLLIHLPGYGAEMSAHPELVAAGYHVLHVNPRGYCTPAGFDEAQRRANGWWPVLPETAESGGERGYRTWLRDAAIATRWAAARPEVDAQRIGLFGTSQGGGAAILLGSVLREEGVRAVAADVPFLTDFRRMRERANQGLYALAFEAIDAADAARRDEAARAIDAIDTLSHAPRLDRPVLVTAGSEDAVCPPGTIRALYEALPGTRSLTELAGTAHGYTGAFVPLAEAWFRLHV